VEVQPPDTEYARTSDGLYLAYHVFGEGPLDLLVMMSSQFPIADQLEGRVCGRFLRRLARFSRVIRFDRRGFGMSDPVRSFDEHVYEMWVDDILTVLDAAGSRQVAVFSTDQAACFAPLLLAATHPAVVSHLVLYNPSVRLLAAPDYPHGVPPDEIASRLENFTISLLTGSPLETIGFHEPRDVDDVELRLWFLRSRRRGTSPAVARASYDNWLRSDLRAVLPAVNAPTLVLARPDALEIPSAVRHVASNISHARYLEVAGDEGYAFLGDIEPIVHEVEQFLTGTTATTVSDRLLATVLFTDIVDSTVHATALGDHTWSQRLDDHNDVVRRQLERFRGREIDTTGDGFLATFDGPARAIQCARAIRDRARVLGIELRAGLHLGEIEVRADGIAGLTVHIGARVAALAAPGEVLVSRTVVDLVAGSGIQFEDRGEHELKGVPGTWNLFAVTP
jgi:class 3 adenylate cyclase/pimeloyl-ACP methyl ester carboxylesterase